MKPPVVAAFVLSLMVGCTLLRLSKVPVPDGRYGPAIRAAASVGFSSDRTSTLRDIAVTPGLNEGEQMYLIEVLRITGGFSADKTRVLVALLKNPGITAAAKTKIAELLPELGLFSTDAKQVADAFVG